jgi:hypothetical protein
MIGKKKRCLFKKIIKSMGSKEGKKSNEEVTILGDGGKITIDYFMN